MAAPIRNRVMPDRLGELLNQSSEEDSEEAEPTRIWAYDNACGLQELYETCQLPVVGGEHPQARYALAANGNEHPFTYSWARAAGLNTNQVQLTRLILLAENRALPNVARKPAAPYITALNTCLEQMVMQAPPPLPGLDGVSRTLLASLEARSYLTVGLARFQRMLADIVSGVSPNAIMVLPSTVTVEVPMSVFVHLLPPGVHLSFVGRHSNVWPQLAFARPPDQVTALLPPTERELATDGAVHPVYGHLLRQRWYSSYRDAVMHGLPIADALHVNVDPGTFRVLCDLRRKQMRVAGTYVIRRKRWSAAVDPTNVLWSK
jgi:hypothetical protein